MSETPSASGDADSPPPPPPPPPPPTTTPDLSWLSTVEIRDGYPGRIRNGGHYETKDQA